MAFLRKRCPVNPTRGPFHFRAPGRIFWRVVRGMMRHKTAKGQDALNRLKVFEGVPPPYDKVKRMVVPAALRVVRLEKHRKWCTLGRLSHEMGWKYQEIVGTLEEKRKVKSKAFYLAKKAQAVSCLLFFLDDKSAAGKKETKRSEPARAKMLQATRWGEGEGGERWVGRHVKAQANISDRLLGNISISSPCLSASWPVCSNSRPRQRQALQPTSVLSTSSSTSWAIEHVA